MNSFQVVKDFERELCNYTGAPYAVSTTSCTMALLLAVAWNLRSVSPWLKACEKKVAENLPPDFPDFRLRYQVEIPKRTYVSVPQSIIHAGGRPTFRDEDWRGAYQLKPLPVWDSARWFTHGMYQRPSLGRIEHLGLRAKSVRVLAEEGIHDVSELVCWTPEDLLKTPNLGPHCLLDIETSLAGRKLKLSQERWHDMPWHERGTMVCVSFHWAKTLGIQQGGAILHDNPEADAWLRRARFDGREEGVAPKEQKAWQLGWHAYMSPETAAAGLVRLALLPRHNDPLPNDDYPDLSTFEIFK